MTLVLVDAIFGCAQNATTGKVDETVQVSDVEPPVKGTIIKVKDPNDSLIIVPTDVPVNAAILQPLSYVILVSCN